MSKRGTAEVMGPGRERITGLSGLSTLQLVKEIALQSGLLVKKQVELAKTELRADVRTEAKVAGGLGVAAICGIIAITLLLVTAAFALALVMPAWGAGLIVTGFVAAVAAVVAGVSWKRRVRQPMEASRHELKRGLHFTKERFA